MKSISIQTSEDLADHDDMPGDMREEFAAMTARDEAPRVIVYKVAESAERAIVIGGNAGRYGVCWGGTTEWTDADSHDDALLRYAGIDGREMSN